MKQASVSDIAAMTVEQRLQLMEDLWNSFVAMPESLPVPEWHQEELDLCLEEYREDPKEGSPWFEVKQRLMREKLC